LKPYYEQDGITIYHGDCREILPSIKADAVVTDPPYGLAFMGKRWDYDVPSVEIWAECLRVLKPGGHLLAFAGTRTQHRMAVRIEDAGFEIRDMIAWVYGSGFPKSLDVSKAIDKTAPRRGQFDAFAEHFDAMWRISGLKRSEFVPYFPHYKNAASVMAQLSNWKLAKNVPTKQDFLILQELLGLSDEFAVLIDRVEAEREVVGVQKNAMSGWNMDGTTKFADRDITAPATEAARQWQGWGTALKPALEPITVARKPLEGTVAENVLKHGVGGINVDGCRVGHDEPIKPMKAQDGGNKVYGQSGRYEETTELKANGRWPANLIHDGSDEVVGLFPVTTSGSSAARFFMQCKGYNDAWPDLNNQSDIANTAGNYSSPSRQAVASALSDAATWALQGAICSSVYLEPSTSATATDLKTLCESVIAAIQSIGPRFWHEREPARLSLTLSRASFAVHREPTGTTTITASHWKSDGSAEPVTFNITATSLEAGEKGLGGQRFRYCAKASKADRSEGNIHPTVKPTDLMRYLCRLVTPPGGIVLDPFMGSGTTLVAAKLEGRKAIGIELEEEYCEIAAKRLAQGAFSF
jgi:DNA modification methylase